MKTPAAIMRFSLLVLMPVLLFAASVSQWSNSFSLKVFNGTRVENLNGLKPEPFGLIAAPNPFNPSVVLKVSGTSPNLPSALRIFGIDGKITADLSDRLHPGTCVIPWRAPAAASGIYVAWLKSGGKTKSIKLILLK